MIERVARVLYEAHKHKTPYENLRPEFQRQYEKQARAAIECMREPTSDMEEAGWDQLPNSPDDWSPVSAYQCMVGAALK